MSKGVVTKEEILDILRKNKKFLKEEFDVGNIMLFGSYARDEATEESDVDILVEAIDRKAKSFDNLFNLKKFLEKILNKKVDVAYIDSVRKFILRFIKEEMIYA